MICQSINRIKIYCSVKIRLGPSEISEIVFRYAPEEISLVERIINPYDNTETVQSIQIAAFIESQLPPEEKMISVILRPERP